MAKRISVLMKRRVRDLKKAEKDGTKGPRHKQAVLRARKVKLKKAYRMA